MFLYVSPLFMSHKHSTILSNLNKETTFLSTITQKNIKLAFQPTFDAPSKVSVRTL